MLARLSMMGRAACRSGARPHLVARLLVKKWLICWCWRRIGRSMVIIFLGLCIEENVKIRWCPAPNCDYAVEYEVGSESYDVYCDCSCGFCWNCNEDAHSPVDCETVAKWILKNISESESVTWLLANSKSCPKCKVAIEKNRGCMHMTCKKPCGYEFCWLCLGPWKEHNGSTGGVHTCNKYQKSKKLSKEEKTREMAKQYLERYTHYYERWAANDRSRGKAKKDLLAIKTDRLQKLEEKLEGSSNRLEFVEKAWLQIIECRSVLKWTYAYGYYLPEHEIFKKQMFEFLQEKAEAALERLHEFAEIELRKFIEKINDEDNEFDKDEFIVSYHMKLTDLTHITRNYFGNLVRALENGLSDVASSKASD